jgi:hypothetical protein
MAELEPLLAPLEEGAGAETESIGKTIVETAGKIKIFHDAAETIGDIVHTVIPKKHHHEQTQSPTPTISQSNNHTMANNLDVPMQDQPSNIYVTIPRGPGVSQGPDPIVHPKRRGSHKTHHRKRK